LIILAFYSQILTLHNGGYAQLMQQYQYNQQVTSVAYRGKGALVAYREEI
jgi:hypothetical protein